MMVKKVLYSVLCTFLIGAFFSGPAHATKARDLGLGLYETPWMIDGLQSYIFENPAYLSKQKGQIFFVRTDENFGGLVYSPITELNIGVFSGVSMNDNIWNSTGMESFFHTGTYDVKANGYQPVREDDLVTTPAIDETNLSLENKAISLLSPSGSFSDDTYRDNLDQQDVSLMASYIWNKMAFGLSVGYGAAWSTDSYDQSTPVEQKDEYAFSSTQIDVIAAWLFAFNDEMDVDVDVHWTQYLLSNTYDASQPGIDTELSYESEGAMDILIGAGFNWDYTSVHKLHTKVGVGILNHSAMGSGKYANENDTTNDFDVEEKYDRNGTQISLGVSDEMRFTKETTGFVGFNFVLKSFEYAYSGTDGNNAVTDDEEFSGAANSKTVPLIMGIETKISENWTARFSMVHNLWDPQDSTTDQSTDAEAALTTTSSSSDMDDSADTQLNLGLSYQLGGFRLDWLANIDMFIEGPYLITGNYENDTGIPMSMAFAATYYLDYVNKKSVLEEQ